MPDSEGNYSEAEWLAGLVPEQDDASREIPLEWIDNSGTVGMTTGVDGVVQWWEKVDGFWTAVGEKPEAVEENPEVYFDVAGDRVMDNFDTNTSEPLTGRQGWTSGFDDTQVFVRLSDRPLPEGAIPIVFYKEWMIAGHTYAVVVNDDVETWWEKVEGAWPEWRLWPHWLRIKRAAEWRKVEDA